LTALCNIDNVFLHCWHPELQTFYSHRFIHTSSSLTQRSFQGKNMKKFPLFRIVVTSRKEMLHRSKSEPEFANAKTLLKYLIGDFPKNSNISIERWLCESLPWTLQHFLCLYLDIVPTYFVYMFRLSGINKPRLGPINKNSQIWEIFRKSQKILNQPFLSEKSEKSM
jgi:hypothetical protein